MTWTYSGDPAASALDAVRFLVGDTDSTATLISNEEITYALSKRGGNVYGAGAFAARAIGAKYARLVSTSADGVSIQTGQLKQQYFDLAGQLEEQSKVFGAAPPYCGGIDNAEFEANKADPSVKRLNFALGQFDNPVPGVPLDPTLGLNP